MLLIDRLTCQWRCFNSNLRARLDFNRSAMVCSRYSSKICCRLNGETKLYRPSLLNQIFCLR